MKKHLLAGLIVTRFFCGYEDLNHFLSALPEKTEKTAHITNQWSKDCYDLDNERRITNTYDYNIMYTIQFRLTDIKPGIRE